jgi:Ca2+:H+ antiporter
MRRGVLESRVWKRKINFFLLAIPLVLFNEQLGLSDWISEHLGVPGGPVLLVIAALGLIPLAGFVESAVEELAELLGPFVGGLLHTTFSNVAELSIALSVLLTFRAPEGPEIVLSSIAGVIIRNSLLFLGVATFLGCLKNGSMKFNAEHAGEYATVFALAVIGLSLPTVAALIQGAPSGGGEGVAHIASALTAATPGEGGPGELVVYGIPLGTALAVVLLVSYLAYVMFAVFRVRDGRSRPRRPTAAFGPALALAQQDTQALFDPEREQAEARNRAEEEERRLHPRAQQARARRRAAAEERARSGKPPSLLERSKALRGVLAAIVLALATAGVFALSEQFAHAAEDFSSSAALGPGFGFFFGLIVIPIVGGVVELYGTVGSARERHMEIVMALTAGATIQMILFVVPVLVLVGAIMNHPLDLVFKPIEIIIFGASTFAFMLLSRDGESSIMEGVQLITLWTLLAITALALPPG